MATKHLKTYRDSRGNDLLIAEMKTAKVASIYKANAKKLKALENAVNCKGYANPAQERKQKELTKIVAAFKAELILRNPFNLEGILNGF
ncbi:VHS1094 protein [Vibrio phage 1]|nr:VHS1094 protein [Vibrio phage 1]